MDDADDEQQQQRYYSSNGASSSGRGSSSSGGYGRSSSGSRSQQQPQQQRRRRQPGAGGRRPPPLPGSVRGDNAMQSADPFAAFKSYQQAALLQAAGVGRGALDAGLRPDQGWMPEAPGRLKPLLSRGWHAQPGFTVQTLYEELLRRCEQQETMLAPLFMLIKLAETREDARTVLDAAAALRTCRVRKGLVLPYNSALCALFTKMCYTCDAPDVLAEALHRSTELGLMLGHNRVHDVLREWGAAHELYKMEQVVASMEQGGIPPNTKTAYIVIRAAVNAGRLEYAEGFARSMTQAGVRLHTSTLRLLDTGRRAQMAAAGGPAPPQGLYYGGDDEATTGEQQRRPRGRAG